MEEMHRQGMGRGHGASLLPQHFCVFTNSESRLKVFVEFTLQPPRLESRAENSPFLSRGLSGDKPHPETL